MKKITVLLSVLLLVFSLTLSGLFAQNNPNQNTTGINNTQLQKLLGNLKAELINERQALRNSPKYKSISNTNIAKNANFAKDLKAKSQEFPINTRYS